MRPVATISSVLGTLKRRIGVDHSEDDDDQVTLPTAVRGAYRSTDACTPVNSVEWSPTATRRMSSAGPKRVTEMVPAAPLTVASQLEIEEILSTVPRECRREYTKFCPAWSKVARQTEDAEYARRLHDEEFRAVAAQEEQVARDQQYTE